MKSTMGTVVSIAIGLTIAGCSATNSGAPDSTAQTDSNSVKTESQEPTTNTSAAPSASSDRWVIHQKSEIAGIATKQVLTFTPDGSRCESTGAIEVTYVIHKKPDWHVTAFSKGSKLMYDTTIDQWKKDRKDQADSAAKMRKSMSGGAKDAKYEKQGTETIAGMTATRYISKSSDGSTTEAWITDEFKPSYEQRGVFTKELDGLPEGNFMLKLVITAADGEKTNALDTTKVEKIAATPAGLTDVPSGYKKVAKELDVVMGAGAGKEFKDMAEAFGGGSEEK